MCLVGGGTGGVEVGGGARAAQPGQAGQRRDAYLQVPHVTGQLGGLGEGRQRLLPPAETATDLGQPVDPGGGPVQPQPLRDHFGAGETQGRLVVAAQPEQRLTRVVQGGHQHSRRAGEFRRADRPHGGGQRRRVPGLPQQAVRLVDQDPRLLDQVTRTFGRRQRLGEVPVTAGAGRGQRGRDVRRRQRGVLVDPLRRDERPGPCGDRVVDPAELGEGAGAAGQQQDVVGARWGERRRRVHPVEHRECAGVVGSQVRHHRGPPEQPRRPATVAVRLRQQRGEDPRRPGHRAGHPQRVAEDQLQVGVLLGRRQRADQVGDVGRPATGEHLRTVADDQRRAPGGVVRVAQGSGGRQRVRVLEVPVGGGGQPLAARDVWSACLLGQHRREHRYQLHRRRGGVGPPAGVGHQQPGAGRPLQRVRGGVGGRVGVDGHAQRRGDRVEAVDAAKQTRHRRGQVGKDLVAGELPAGGAGLGQGGEQLPPADALPAERVTGEVYPRWPAGGQLVDQVGQVTVGDRVFVAQDPGDLVPTEGEGFRSAVHHGSGAGAAGRVGERVSSGQRHRRLTRQRAQQTHEGQLLVPAERGHLVHGDPGRRVRVRRAGRVRQRVDQIRRPVTGRRAVPADGLQGGALAVTGGGHQQQPPLWSGPPVGCHHVASARPSTEEGHPEGR
ncbi:hypothetical protein B0E54_03542 [Micromonospora sp. MH99]|nr:hypothetical protein [Micromonospora sp. MH99]